MPSQFPDQTQIDQPAPTAELKSRYDFIVCGAGSSGCVVARRLAENPDVSVLLLEAGGDDDAPAVTDAAQWLLNVGSERDWGFRGRANPHLNGRSIPFAMGKVLGGGSSINGMVWARGHRSDWDLYASESGDPAWSYDAVLQIYRRIEDWHGPPDPEHRGADGPVFVEPAPDPNPLAPATLEGARSVGIPTFENPNGQMMEAARGASIMDILVRDGRRQSVFRSYVFPFMDRSNLTVLQGALVTRLIFDGRRADGVEIRRSGQLLRIDANLEVVLSLGAIHTPKVLMQSGIGDRDELARLGIPVVQHLPGVGRNFQDHLAFACVWEYRTPLPPRNNMAEAAAYWTSEPGLDRPDLFVCAAEWPFSTEECAAKFGLPEAGWTLFGALCHPKSRGWLRLSGPDPSDPILIEDNILAHPEDWKLATACVERLREIGASAPLRPFMKREVLPGSLEDGDFEDFMRNAATNYWHETCTAKMGRDQMSVVDGELKVYGVDNLRIADGSIFPRIPSGNTMAPCVIVGERAAETLRRTHSLSVL